MPGHLNVYFATSNGLTWVKDTYLLFKFVLLTLTRAKVKVVSDPRIPFFSINLFNNEL